MATGNKSKNVVPVVSMIHRAEREPSAQALCEDLRNIIVFSEKGSIVKFLITILTSHRACSSGRRVVVITDIRFFLVGCICGLITRYSAVRVIG